MGYCCGITEEVSTMRSQNSIDELGILEDQGKQERKEKREARKRDVEVQEAKKQGRRNKRKGVRKEMELEELLYRFGFIRRLDSGVMTGGDVVRVIRDGRVLGIGENKFRHDGQGFEMLYKYFAQSHLTDFVVVGKANAKRLFVIPEDKFIRLLEEAGYDKFSEVSNGYMEWRARAEKRKSLRKK